MQGLERGQEVSLKEVLTGLGVSTEVCGHQADEKRLELGREEPVLGMACDRAGTAL